MKAPLIYNLFPRLLGPMNRWPAHASRAKAMGFNWLFLNPVQYPGFSGSLYAIKDLYRINPLFITPGVENPFQELKSTLAAFHDAGFQVMMDLVINHTSKDSLLIQQHPTWFLRDERGEVKSPSAIDPADARHVTVWGDLAEVDNETSPDREDLWAYWVKLVKYYLDLGFDGFRCDAAYKVPRQLWESLIGTAQKYRPGVIFSAETLGCRLAEVNQLKGTGFNYLFNSSKWWNFDATWCLEQHADFQKIAPSISFPESHDTPRLMQETGGLVQVQKQRYAVAAFFASGLLMPIGYEFGFTKRLNVVQTTPHDWEETSTNLSPFITEINHLKNLIPVLSHEGHWKVLTSLDKPTVTLAKTATGQPNPAVLIINKDWHQPQIVDLLPATQFLTKPANLFRPFSNEISHPSKPTTRHLQLAPAEVALITPLP